MKKKILSLLAAFFMLFGTSAMAQVDSTLEGDVNGDGVVDIADITAVIAIIKQNAEANPTYYWYAGWTEPTAENIAELVNKQYPADTKQTTFTNAGKSATTTSNEVYDLLTRKYYDDEYINATQGNRVKRNYYIVVPNGQGIYDSLGTKLHLDTAFASVIGTFANHTIYKSRDTSISITSFIIK